MDISNSKDIVQLDYEGKIALLEKIAEELIDKRIEFSKVSSRFAELRADIQVLKQIASVLQSALRAEGARL